MQQINVNELKPHPRNNEFFDDMSGEKWQEFLTSIKDRGVIEPIVITPDKVIVSGHQRVRACKELGIQTVMCDVHTYDNEDQILQDLIETNIRQRGNVGGSAKKVGKRIKELERICGIKNGSQKFRGNQYVKVSSNDFNSSQKTQEQLASDMGITVKTLQNYKLMAEMIPELEELIETGIVTKTTALAMMKNLSSQEQEELISSLDTTKRITQKEMQKYIDEIRSLKANPPKPSDYDPTKWKLAYYKKDYSNLHSQFEDKIKETQELRKQMENMRSKDASEKYTEKSKKSATLFCTKVFTFIEQIGDYVWLTDKINEIPEFEREGYIKAVHAIKSLADIMEHNINKVVEGIDEKVETFSNDIKQLKLNEEVTTTQQETLTETAKKRVLEILGNDPLEHKKYFKIFIQRLYRDARKNAGLGFKIAHTRKDDFQRCIDYMEALVPECGCAELRAKADINAKARMEEKMFGYID